MARNPRETLLLLVTRATSPTGKDDEEARNAAVRACELLMKHGELLAAPTGSNGVSAPERRSEMSSVHPEAARLNEWRSMLRRKSLREPRASGASLCADCGKPIRRHKEVVESRQGLATHRGCSGWWWNFEDDQDNDILF